MEPETKRTNKDILYKGLKKMGISLLCMFIGPSLLHVAFTNQEKPLYLALLILGLVIGVLAIVFAFKGLQTIMKSMFD
ncbi:DUF6095 family protein [Bizionia sp. KMM 8389]